MSSEQQIQNLIVQYTHYVDQARFDKVGDLFANGKIISPDNVMEGKEEVVNQLSKNLQVYADGTLRTAHLTTKRFWIFRKMQMRLRRYPILPFYKLMPKEDFLYNQLPWGVTMIPLSVWMDVGNFRSGNSLSHWQEIFHTTQHQIPLTLRQSKTEGNKLFENIDKSVRQNGNETFRFDELKPHSLVHLCININQ